MTTLSAQDAATIASDAYLYLYPLVTMDLTRKQLTNHAPGPGVFGGPMNMFVNVQSFPPADFKAVVRPNFDTLYSSAYLDLTGGPVVVSAPDTQGRYYLLPMIDMWSDVFASPGSRTTGTGAADFLVTPPEWTGAVPAGCAQTKAPTPYVWIIGRTRTDGPEDYEAVRKVQAGLRITTLADWPGAAKPIVFVNDPDVDMITPPKVTVDTMSGPAFFAYAAELLKLHPPHITDQPIIARMARIGIEAGKSFDAAIAGPVVARAIDAAPAAAMALMAWKLPTIASVANHWSMNTDTMGVYGNYYLKRAIVAQVGLGANVPEDAIYPLNLGDADGQPLDGANNYKLHFEKDATPPVDAFWSITLYDSDGFQVGNILNRFALSSWMQFNTNPDGSLDLFFQADSPGNANQPNWLPAPKGPFNLTMRLYAPHSDALTGKWSPPAVLRN
jgi:hypothetical protein